MDKQIWQRDFNGYSRAGVKYVMKAEMKDLVSSVSSLQAASTSTDKKLDETNQKIDGLLKDVFDRAFPKAGATKAALREAIPQANVILAIAKRENLRLNPTVLSEYGKGLISLKGDADAWRSLTVLLNYSSQVNNGPMLPSPMGARTHYFIENFSSTSTPSVSAFGVADWEHSARLNKIGVDMNKGMKEGNAFIQVEGDVVRLDEMEIKNVIFRNVHIVYWGGQLQMDNVYFLNCTFEIYQKQRSENLVAKLLSSNPVQEFNGS